MEKSLKQSCDSREKLHEAHSDLQKKREVIDDLEPKVDGSSEWLLFSPFHSLVSVVSNGRSC